MSPEQWRQVVHLVECASDLPLGRQRLFLESQTTDPAVIERCLELLVIDSAPDQPCQNECRTGTRLGHYVIGEAIGRGGMGEVYAAIDVDLDRPVAIKFLPAGVLGDEKAVKRFLSEAKASSALNHPNILTIHEFVRDEGVLAIVMEKIEGQTLRALGGRLLSLDQFLSWARQLAAALTSAHERQIIHRDIKPENLMLRSDGYLKLVDFGLASLAGTGARGEEVRSEISTRAGTWNYMSPEQMRGEPLRSSSDIYSFGIVCEELLTGLSPVVHASTSIPTAPDTNSVARIRHLRPSLPPDLIRLLERMLDPDPALRPTAKDIGSALESIAALHGSGGVSTRRRAWIASAVSVAAASAIAMFFVLRSSAPPPANGWRSRPLTSFPGVQTYPAFSPDGKRIAFTWDGRQRRNRDIYVQTLAGEDVQRLTAAPEPDLRPAWSPDGRSIAFLRMLGNGRKDVRIMSSDGTGDHFVAGIYSADLGQCGEPGVSWSPNGRFLFTAEQSTPALRCGLVRISIDTGEKLPLSTPESDDNDPAISPDGRTLAFVRTTASAAHNIYLMPATGGRPRPLTSGNYDTIGLAWMDSQRIVAATTRGQGPRNLWVFPASGGSPARLTDSLSALKFPTASSGRLVYSMARDDFHIWRAEHDGENVWITSSGLDSSPQYSSTGRIAFRSSRTGSNEIWVCDGDGSNPRRITDLGGLVGSPSWSPDRTRIAFDSTRSGNSDIYLADPAGDMPPRRLTAEATNEVMPSWSPDGRFLYYGSNRTGRWRVWRIPAEGPGEPEAVTPEAGARGIPLPDGKYLATHDTAPGETTASIFLFRVTPPGTSYPSTSPSPSERLIEGLEPDLWGAWTVGAEGIYFLQKDDLASPRAKESGYSVRLFDPLTRRTRSLFRLAGTPLKGDLGITVSPDGRFVLYTRRESDSSTLVLLERSQ